MRMAAVIGRRLSELTARVRIAPVFVLGNQKSGTSAVAMLLGQLTGLSVANDLRREIGEQLIMRIRANQASLADLVRRNRVDFSRHIVKHPNLTLVYEELHRAFPASRFVFVMREPRDNIRSILDRLGLPGTISRIEKEQWAKVPAAWQAILRGDGLGIAAEHPIEVLACRWNFMADVYLQQGRDMKLIRYEDFLMDKLGSIRALAVGLDLQPVADISDRLDQQFQPRGAHRGIDPLTFFGDNLERITAICRGRMAELGYQ